MKQNKILIVDDNEQNRYLLSALLKGHGFEVVTANNGAEALEKAKRNPPVLAVSDILMPVMDGFTLCREWKKDEDLKVIPFVLYTATYTDPQDEAFAIKIGADRFIAKPCDPDALIRAICDVIAGVEKLVAPLAPESEQEDDVLRLYNQRLVRKLEDKMMQLENAYNAKKQTEMALSESEEKHRLLFETMPQGVVYQSKEGNIVYANPAAEKILGLTVDQMRLRTSSDARWKVIHEDGSDFPGETHPSMIALQTGQSVKDVVMGVYNPRLGQRCWIKTSAVPLFRTGEEKPYQVYTTFDDITEYKKLQAQFMQSQKMEAVGALAGGVAHDFNNLLTVIKGYAEMLLENFSPGDPRCEDARQILKAGKQAESLTTQLLAFSRKQLLQPKLLKLNDIVNDVEKMLHRLLGEDIDIVARTQPDLGLIHADPGQIQQILMNLAVNARDAMPNGGKLFIETADVNFDDEHIQTYAFVKPGLYIMLAISDTGTGMDARTQARIFEPFFTTKAQGAGTGLGLSTVYGIVKQSNGFILVDSEPGKGANFRIYFPRVEGEPAILSQDQDSELASGRGETVLVVEDEPSVRSLTCRILRERGYRVLEAQNGEEALDLARVNPGKIHLVITDVVMPGISGAELVSRLGTLLPGIRALYVSGYAGSGIVDHNKLDPNVAFLQKPFAIDLLLRKIQSVLES